MNNAMRVLTRFSIPEIPVYDERRAVLEHQHRDDAEAFYAAEAHLKRLCGIDLSADNIQALAIENKTVVTNHIDF